MFREAMPANLGKLVGDGPRMSFGPGVRRQRDDEVPSFSGPGGAEVGNLGTPRVPELDPDPGRLSVGPLKRHAQARVVMRMNLGAREGRDAADRFRSGCPQCLWRGMRIC